MATNNYIPEYVPSDLKWYERDCLMTYIDQVKCEEFLSDPDKHFREKKIVNFDITYKSIRGKKVPEGDRKKYRAVQDNRVKQYFQQHRDKFCPLHLRQIERICTLKTKSFNLIFLHYVRKNSCARIWYFSSIYKSNKKNYF